jgi:peptide/nickel transport system permease protein
VATGLKREQVTVSRFGRGGRRVASGRAGPAALRHPTLIGVGRRLLVSVPLLFVVSILVFLLMSLAQEDPTERILGPRKTSGLPEWRYQQLAHQLGIDQPLLSQYWHWLDGALHGNLGHSWITQQPITEAITQRFPVTLSLTIGAVMVSVVIGVALGVFSAVRGGATGRTVDVLAMLGWVAPVYWLAAELVVVFAVKLNWLPATGYVPLIQSPLQWLRSLVLPVLALALGGIGLFAKFTREQMLDVLSSEYIRMARGNGISPASLVLRHAFKTASLQVVTQAGMLVVGLLIGTVFVEQVFALPGMGSLIVTGAEAGDVPMVQGVALFFTLIVVAVNLIVDLAYGLLSPKVQAA